MDTSKQNTSQIVHLAKRLEEDIRARSLKPGDPYLNTQETARMLGVSNAAANRALQLLVKRNTLRRRQRSGTFIAEPTKRGAADVEMNLSTFWFIKTISRPKGC
jgi:DNA-binding GntR family transcriptional regulator